MSLDNKKDQEKIFESNSIVSANSVENIYPENVRILAVDDNPVCLQLLEDVLGKCGYQYTATRDTAEAYNILKKNRNSYNLVLTDVKNNGEGLEFAHLIDREMDIPVVIMSSDDRIESVLNGIKHGAQNYLVKPVRYEELKVIWQHVARKKHFRVEKTITDKTETNPNAIAVRCMDDTIDPEAEIKTRFIKENKKLRLKKPRFSWKKEMRTKFENVVAQLGVEHAVPKKILELMNEPMLTRENVASHLQKFRKNRDMKKEKDKRKAIECENAIKNIQCSNTLPNYSVNHQYIPGQHYHNNSMEPMVTETNLHAFGEKLRNNNLRDGMPQNHLPFSLMDEQISRTTENNPANNFSVTSSHSSQYFGPRHEADAIRFNSNPRLVKSENNHIREHLWHNHSRFPPSPAHLTNSLFNLPPNSTSSGHFYMPDRNHPNQMVQPINYLPMVPSSSSYGQIPIADSTYPAQVAHPTNYQRMPAPSPSFRPLERGNSINFKGTEENKNLSREPSLDFESLLSDPALQFSDSDLHSNDTRDELFDMVHQFDDNPPPSF